jgi:small subunit ribosomal protein S7
MASTSALRVLNLHRSVSSIATTSKRHFSGSSLRHASYDGSRNNATPARAHREGTDVSRAAGGPDLDPVTRLPRNSSTAASVNPGAQLLAKFAESLQNKSMTNSEVQDVPFSTTPASDPLNYSTELLPLKIDPTLEAFVNNLMKDGKKASATRHVLGMMEYLSQALHADPLPALLSAVRSAGPLVRMQSRKNGGKNIAVPIALGPDQSRRRGIIAIIEASKKRSDKRLSVRMAREVIAVLEGSSSTLARKEEIHRVAMVNRSNASVRI